MTSDADAAEAFDILSRPFTFEMLHYSATNYATYAAKSTLSLAIVGQVPKPIWPLSAESDVGRRYLERLSLGRELPLLIARPDVTFPPFAADVAAIQKAAKFLSFLHAKYWAARRATCSIHWRGPGPSAWPIRVTIRSEASRAGVSGGHALPRAAGSCGRCVPAGLLGSRAELPAASRRARAPFSERIAAAILGAGTPRASPSRSRNRK